VNSSNEGPAEQFTVQGMTGVDLTLDIAGPGSRSYAFIIDWHIRLLLALAWIGMSLFLATGGWHLGEPREQAATWAIFLPAAVIYFFYHPVLELLMRGQSPGKRMAGVRVATREGGQPGTGAILIRNVFRLVDSLPSLYAIGLLCTLFSRQRVRIGDMAAGTVLLSNERFATRSLDRLAGTGSAGGIDPNLLDLIDQLLERWPKLDPTRRLELAHSLLLSADPAPPRPPAELNEKEAHARLVALAQPT